MSELLRSFSYKMFARIFKNKQFEPPIPLNENAKILIFRYDKIGDMVVSFPSFELLKYHFPKVELWVLSSETNDFLLENYRPVTRHIVLPKSFFKGLKTILYLRKQRFNVIINYVFYRTTKAGLLANLINPNAIKVNLGHQNRDKYYSNLFNLLYPYSLRGNIPMSEFLCRYLSWVFGIEFDASFLVRYNFNLPEESIQRAKEFLISLGGGRRILINISARRKWSIDYYKELIQLLQKEFPNDVIVFIAHPSDYSMLDKILYGFDTNVFAFYGNSFYDVIALISMVDLVFTPDTSIVHFANAFKIKTVVIYTANDSYLNEWLPTNSDFLYHLSRKSDRSNDILPESIFESIKLLLNK